MYKGINIINTLKELNMQVTAIKVKKFKKLRIKKTSLFEDIIFLKRCKTKSIFPNFIKLKPTVTNSRSNGAIKKAKRIWLCNEIKFKYSLMNSVNKNLYKTYSEICSDVFNVCPHMWLEHITTIESMCEELKYKKKTKLKKKFDALQEKMKIMIPRHRQFSENGFNNVMNFSNEVFTNEQMSFLNKGLKFKLPPKKTPFDEIVVNIESKLNIMNLNQHEKAVIREDCSTAIRKSIPNQIKRSKSASNIIGELKEKDVYYVNFDKGEGVAILDKNDYDNRIWEAINEGPYKEKKIDGRWKDSSPLNKLKTEVQELLSDLNQNYDLPSNVKRSLTVSNPKLPIIYGSLKVHKLEKKMRLIVRYTNSPTEKISKWIVKEFNKLNYPKGNFVKDSIDFVEKMKDVKIDEDEMMVKFDVISMFPSIPIEIALTQIKLFLDTKDLNEKKKKILIKMLDLCMKQRTFQFRNKFFDQTSGATIGNAASPLIADFLMGYFEKKIKFKNWCPKIMLRYVDDYFAIIKKEQLDDILDLMNMQIPQINFTMDVEENDKISYLDLIIQKRNRNIIFDIFRKPTSTGLFIRKDSYHHQSHQAAAFHSMIHKLLNIPLSEENYQKELRNIENLAILNGYTKAFVHRILKKHKRKKEIQNITTLSVNKEKDVHPSNYISIPFCGDISRRLSQTLKKHRIGVAHKNDGKLCDILQNRKDVDHNICHQSGVYLLRCEEPGCDSIYIGETRRRFITRWDEHINDTTKAPNEESAMAYHAITNNHDIKFFEALKIVQDPSKLKAYESLHLYLKRNENLTNNFREGNLPSMLYKIVEENM